MIFSACAFVISSFIVLLVKIKLYNSFGAGVGSECDSTKARYEDIVLVTDADPDGIGHIASLIINMFYKWFPEVIRQGKLYILQTPLLSVKHKNQIK
jgi:DNA gyrase subunit B